MPQIYQRQAILFRIIVLYLIYVWMGLISEGMTHL